MCQFREPALNASQVMNNTKSMKVGYDNNLDMSALD